jgi:hypothetical protein
MKVIGMVLLGSLVELSALAQDVRYNFAADTDFAKYKTYKWGEIKGADRIDQITDGQLRGAINGELAKKGLALLDTAAADLVIAYQVSIGQEKEITTLDSGYGYGPGWGWYGYGGSGFSTTTTSTITIGQVDLDIYDLSEKKLVWRGTASKTLDMKAKPDKRQKNILKGVAKLLRDFPPPQKKKN